MYGEDFPTLSTDWDSIKAGFEKLAGEPDFCSDFGDPDLFQACRKQTARETHWAAFPIVRTREPKIALIAKWCVGPAQGQADQSGRVCMAPLAECPNLPGDIMCPPFTRLAGAAMLGFHNAILAAKAIALKEAWRELPDALVWISPMKRNDFECIEAIGEIAGESSSLALTTALLSYWSPDPMDPYLGGLLSGAIEVSEDWKDQAKKKLEGKEPFGNLANDIRIGAVSEVDFEQGAKGLKTEAWERWNRHEPNKFHRFLIPDKAKAEESAK